MIKAAIVDLGWRGSINRHEFCLRRAMPHRRPAALAGQAWSPEQVLVEIVRSLSAAIPTQDDCEYLQSILVAQARWAESAPPLRPSRQGCS